mmetsp:Transcript_18520/g.42738  ORF Transcript_18520/g.42738 Transcript_18520/m.42738 type:complete len:107 (-) Transcript_18520:806-1126(-)
MHFLMNFFHYYYRSRIHAKNLSVARIEPWIEPLVSGTEQSSSIAFAFSHPIRSSCHALPKRAQANLRHVVEFPISPNVFQKSRIERIRSERHDRPILKSPLSRFRG